MNLNNIKEQLLRDGEKIGLKVEEETADKLTLHAEIIAKAYFKDSIYMRVVVFESGTLHVFLTFDELEKTYDNLFLINKFNAENPWFRAYIGNINGKDYFELHYTSFSLEKDEEVSETVGFLLRELLEQDTLTYLRPILETKNQARRRAYTKKEGKYLVFR